MLDDVDRHLLRLLQADARCSLDWLAAEVGRSVASVGRRLSRMRSEGVILREVAIVDPKKVGRGMSFVVLVELEREKMSDLERFRSALRREPLVQQSFYVTGESDFILIVRARDMDEYEALTQRLFYGNGNVRRFRTSVCLAPAPIGTAVCVD